MLRLDQPGVKEVTQVRAFILKSFDDPTYKSEATMEVRVPSNVEQETVSEVLVR